MMGPIGVGVFEGDEIFRRGVVSCLDEDPVLAVVDQEAYYDADSINAAAFDVAVVSAAALEAGVPACPLVACVTENMLSSATTAAPNVYAILSRRTLAPEQLVSAVRAAA